jgi:hypothetical protein
MRIMAVVLVAVYSVCVCVGGGAAIRGISLKCVETISKMHSLCYAQGSWHKQKCNCYVHLHDIGFKSSCSREIQSGFAE